jgi:hypothetical protein
MERGYYRPLCRSLNIESPAEWLKSGKESGEVFMFWVLVSILDWFLSLSAHLKLG